MMSFFSASRSGRQTATWNYVQTPPVGGSVTGVLKFLYDPESVPTGMIGGSGTMTPQGSPDSDSFCWVYSNGVLTWQLTNQTSQTATTYWAVFNGSNEVAGNYCNYQIGFVLGGVSATYVGP